MSGLAIARQLANGGRVDDVAAAFGVTRRKVMDAGFDHGMRYLDGKDTFAMTDKATTMLRVAEPPTPTGLPKPAPQRSIVTVGLDCPDPKVRRAAEKARDAVERLRDLLAAWEDRAAARAEVDRLEAELAAAKAKLNGRPAAATSTPAASEGEIRTWALANGVGCPARGRVPGAVRDAYDAAHKASP